MHSCTTEEVMRNERSSERIVLKMQRKYEGNRHQKVVTDQLLFHSADSSIFSNLMFISLIVFIFFLARTWAVVFIHRLYISKIFFNMFIVWAPWTGAAIYWRGKSSEIMKYTNSRSFFFFFFFNQMYTSPGHNSIRFSQLLVFSLSYFFSNLIYFFKKCLRMSKG